MSCLREILCWYITFKKGKSNNAGRGKTTPAYSHSLNEEHHVYINLQTLKVYILPESYEVKSAALDDIKYVVNPTFTKSQITKLDKENQEKYTLTNEKYIPGKLS
jgi:U4/U6.U5 tri-snRNP-associated protein 2